MSTVQQLEHRGRKKQKKWVKWASDYLSKVKNKVIHSRDTKKS